MSRRLVLALVSGVLPFIAGCGSDKEKAIEGLELIKAACADNDKDLAKKLTQDLSAKNVVFKKAFDAAVDEKGGSVNHCSPLLHNEITTRLKHGS